MNRRVRRVLRCRIQQDREAGSALVEFCFLAVLMLLPLVYLVVALGRIQAGAFAAQAAAREAGRAFVTAQDEPDGRVRAEAAAAMAMADQGFRSSDRLALSLVCAEPRCLAPDAWVTVRTRVQVVLPAVPRLLDQVIPLRVDVRATQVYAVDRFRAQGSLAPVT